MPTRHTPTRTSSLLLSLSLAAMPVLAADNPVAHQHGHADLQLAVDHERIDLVLLSPAYNLMGFEHKPRTEAQRQRVQTVESWAVETPLITVLGIDCTITSASMHASWGDTDDHKHDDKHDEHKHGHQHHDDHAQSATHSDVEITQTLNCPGLSESSRLQTSLMTHFPELEHLNVQWVGPQGQGATRLTPGNSQFRLSR
ncbi:ZrgA family zinc uptake protein [Marinobacter halophilus]|uniref:DUF2796 domain-containing protein n=1 Tax=Marinobacter halophilus TaxID=1323740 RepID=A0A2T1KEW9_9GAMM|nr:DUF2796 domain-containing protein [Marinobacter halophilus]PSF08674.1 DUF2796 domain-containing protein [Marinobacter halophilus]GGC62749.1 hypothetical protein GCM10011362_08960 [Marinobacter halophilus]